MPAKKAPSRPETVKLGINVPPEFIRRPQDRGGRGQHDTDRDSDSGGGGVAGQTREDRARPLARLAMPARPYRARLQTNASPSRRVSPAGAALHETLEES